MQSRVAAPWLRRTGIALAVLGLTLLGGALAAIVQTRTYQARQGRAFFHSERKTSPPAADLVSSPPPPVIGSSASADAADPLVLGMIEIPRIGLSAVVREGDDDATLAVAVGHIPGTARPGEPGNVALAGHRDSLFRALRRVRLGDTVRIRTVERGFEYEVEAIEVVSPEETRVLSPREGALTLVTCYPFGWIGDAPKRFIVRARLVP